MGYLLLFLLQDYLKWLDLVEHFESYMPVRFTHFLNMAIHVTQYFTK